MVKTDNEETDFFLEKKIQLLTLKARRNFSQ